MKALPYQFAEPENTACFSCKHIFHEAADILMATHDVDGGWQFLCGGDHVEADAMIVGMGEVVKVDPSVNALYEMPKGIGAFRDNPDSEWKPYRLSSE